MELINKAKLALIKRLISSLNEDVPSKLSTPPSLAINSEYLVVVTKETSQLARKSDRVALADQAARQTKGSFLIEWLSVVVDVEGQRRAAVAEVARTLRCSPTQRGKGKQALLSRPGLDRLLSGIAEVPRRGFTEHRCCRQRYCRARMMGLSLLISLWPGAVRAHRRQTQR